MCAYDGNKASDNCNCVLLDLTACYIQLCRFISQGTMSFEPLYKLDKIVFPKTVSPTLINLFTYDSREGVYSNRQDFYIIYTL